MKTIYMIYMEELKMRAGVRFLMPFLVCPTGCVLSDCMLDLFEDDGCEGVLMSTLLIRRLRLQIESKF